MLAQQALVTCPTLPQDAATGRASGQFSPAEIPQPLLDKLSQQCYIWHSMFESANRAMDTNSQRPSAPPELTARQRLILELVVREYTEAASPVGSRNLVANYALDVSPATIRSELARLEEMGYLTHPHTSAGRVPTELGYRYFVENLMYERELPAWERTRIRHQFHQLGLELDQWLQLSAAVLADTVRNAALVTVPKAAEVRFKHLELIGTYDTAVLLVLVLQDGTVRQRGLHTSQAMPQQDLSNVSARLSRVCLGLTAGEIAALNEDFSQLERDVLTLVVAAMGELERSHTVQSYREGLVHLLAQPEFRNRESFSQVLSFLDSDWLAVKVLPRVFAANGVSVIIGGHDWLEMGDYGLVLTKYGSRSDVMGALGVLGPMRMQYERVIPAVRYMASLLNGLILSLFGPGGQQKGEDQLCDPGTLREVGDSER